MPSQSDNLVKFPFPLRSGEMAELVLPRELHSEDADRITHFLRALQMEPQKALPERAEDREAA